MPPKKIVASLKGPSSAGSGRSAGISVAIVEKIDGLIRRTPIAPPEMREEALTAPEDISMYPLLLHSIYFVAATWRAQLHIPSFVASPAPEQAAAGTSAETAPPHIADRSIPFERRFAQAVALHTGHTFTLDHVARVSALFPDWVQATWFLGSQNQAQFVDAETPLVAIQQQQRSDICCRISLLLDRIPTLDEAKQNVLARHGSLEGIAHVVATHCAQSALEDQWRASREDIAPISLSAVPPSPAGKSKRPRSSSPAKSCYIPPLTPEVSSQLCFLSAVPDSLREALSTDKLGAVLATLDAESKALESNEQARIAATIERERLLSFFDLVRATFGVSKQAVGGEKLIGTLVAQNNFSADERTVRRQLWRLLQLSRASGIRATLDTSVDSEAPQQLIEDNLHLAVFTLDRAVSSRSRIALELTNNADDSRAARPD